jgi:regulator of protease activity HflC (stomatin/prohibitin superfamily)
MLPGGTEQSRTTAVNDALVYRRALTAAFSGLVIQIALLVATGLTALWGDSQALYAAAWHMLGGLPIWIVLALVYQQHESERAQRLAAEKLGEGGQSTAAIFGNLSDDLDAARGRLDRLYRYGLPLVSGLVAVHLLAAGCTLLYFHMAAMAATAANVRAAAGTVSMPASVQRLAAGCDPVGLLFVTAAIAFTAFVSARWISGYARQRSWQLLRGGASYLMSCFVVTLLLSAGAAAVAIADDQRVFDWLAIAIPAVMILVGVEILLTSLLESYRPKVPGEIPRPAFDSRVLGLLTAPESLGRVVAETISYQFGVEVSRSWLYRLLGSAVTPLTALGIGVLLALSCLTIIGPDERGIPLRFGRMAGDPLPPGLHLKWPWPIETIELHPVGQVQEILVSSDLTGQSRNAQAILWTTDSDRQSLIGQEDFLAAPGPSSDGAGSTGVSLVSADVIVQFSVGDLRRFLLGSVDHRQILKLVAQREVSQYFASHDIDDLLGGGRTEAGAVLEAAIQGRLDKAELGIDVVGVAVTALHPPIGTVSRAFHSQIGAVQQRETSIQQARREAVKQLARVAGSVDLSMRIDDAIRRFDALRSAGDAAQAAAAEQEIDRLLADARGEAAELVHAARAYRWSRAVGERASSERFTGELLAYEASPVYYRTRRFLEVLAEGLTGRRKFVITGDSGDTPVFRMDFSDPTSAIDTLLTQ